MCSGGGHVKQVDTTLPLYCEEFKFSPNSHINLKLSIVSNSSKLTSMYYRLKAVIRDLKQQLLDAKNEIDRLNRLISRRSKMNPLDTFKLPPVFVDSELTAIQEDDDFLNSLPNPASVSVKKANNSDLYHTTVVALTLQGDNKILQVSREALEKLDSSSLINAWKSRCSVTPISTSLFQTHNVDDFMICNASVQDDETFNHCLDNAKRMIWRCQIITKEKNFI